MEATGRNVVADFDNTSPEEKAKIEQEECKSLGIESYFDLFRNGQKL